VSALTFVMSDNNALKREHEGGSIDDYLPAKRSATSSS
jgi:hypothetical protein